MKLIKFLLANLLILVVLYANTAVILNYPLSRIAPRFSLPIDRRLYDLFILFGVFSHYETINRDVEIYGIMAATPSFPEGQIIPLNPTDYFPFQRGEYLSRVVVARHSYMQGEAGQRGAFKSLAAKIRERYNRSHPATPIEKIAIVHVAWPRSVEGYESLKTNEALDILFSE